MDGDLFENGAFRKHNFSNIHTVITAASFYSVLSTLLVLLELSVVLYNMFRIVHFGFIVFSTAFYQLDRKEVDLGQDLVVQTVVFDAFI